MPGKLVAWHVEVALNLIALRLRCTPEQLVAAGVAEDLTAFGESVAKAALAAYDAGEITQEYSDDVRHALKG